MAYAYKLLISTPMMSVIRQFQQKLRRATMARTAKQWKLTTAIAGLVICSCNRRSLLSVTSWRERLPIKTRWCWPILLTRLATLSSTPRSGRGSRCSSSNHLSLASSLIRKSRQTLGLMGRPPDAKLTPEIARELCQRIGSKAFIAGSIASLGSEYVIGLRAVNSRSGATVAEEQVQASAKEKVLDALSRGATKLREKLGESLSTLQKFDTPLEQATTTSLEALQAYSLGMKSLVGRGDNAAALSFFKRAIEIDPKFANAYAVLGEVYSNLAEMGLAADAFQKAFSLHDRASEAERFHIDSAYYSWGSGNLEKALPIYEQWERTYPRDYGGFNNLGCVLFQLGQYDRALAQEQEAVRLDPAGGIHYANVVAQYLYLNHFDEAQAAANEAKTKGADSPVLHSFLYELAFVKGDTAGMAEAANWTVGKPGIEDLLVYYQAGTAAYFGSLERSREFSNRAIALAEQAGQKETAAGYSADAALREALLGNSAEAKRYANAALELSNGRDVQSGAALAFALIGDAPEAQKLTDDLAKRFPEDTEVQFNYLPSLRAQLALSRNEPSAAINALEDREPVRTRCA